MSENPDLPVRAAPQHAASLVMYRVGGRSYPLKADARCRVCSSEYRLTIEQEIANARTYSAIVKNLPEGHNLTPRNLRDHYNHGHMPMEVEAMRDIIDERARIRGISIEAGRQALVDHVALAQVTVQKTYEAIAAGELRPTMTDGLRAARLLAAIGLHEEEMSQADLVQAFVQYMEHTQALMTPAMWDDFGRRLATDPILKALKAKAEAVQAPGEQARGVIDMEEFGDR